MAFDVRVTPYEERSTATSTSRSRPCGAISSDRDGGATSSSRSGTIAGCCGSIRVDRRRILRRSGRGHGPGLAPYEFGVIEEPGHGPGRNRRGHYCAHCNLALSTIPAERWGHPSDVERRCGAERRSRQPIASARGPAGRPRAIPEREYSGSAGRSRRFRYPAGCCRNRRSTLPRHELRGPSRDRHGCRQRHRSGRRPPAAQGRRTGHGRGHHDVVWTLSATAGEMRWSWILRPEQRASVSPQRAGTRSSSCQRGRHSGRHPPRGRGAATFRRHFTSTSRPRGSCAVTSAGRWSRAGRSSILVTIGPMGLHARDRRLRRDEDRIQGVTGALRSRSHRARSGSMRSRRHQPIRRCRRRSCARSPSSLGCRTRS